MNLTKKTELEILKVYDTWIYSYLHGDVDTYNSFLDDEYHFIGSVKNEEFLNRKDTTKFFADTGDEFAGKTELRNESKTLEQFGELIFITHIFDGWFLHEKEWTYYARFRFSSSLRKNSDGWRFVYQHFSIPDSKTEEGGTIGYDKINEENQELREAIQRRTVELESKNRALEIEGALQRIRAEAVAMKESSDLLDIVVTMRNEFTRLGHEAHYFWHMMWLEDTYEKAMTSGDGTKIGFVMELPRHMHGDIPLLANWEKSIDPLVIYPMNADEAIAYVDKMVHLGDFKNIDPQAPSHDDIRHINGLTFIMARTTHGEIGYSLPGKVENPPAEDLELLNQFAGAFDLAHRRFLDLQKAEKQAQEIRIELALEKVRSRSMAMHSSEELTEAGALLYQELSKLGIQNLTTGYVLFDETATMGWNYGVNPIDGSIRHKPVGMNHSKTKVMKALVSSWKKQEPLLVQQLNEKETIKHQTFIAEDSIGFPISKEKLLSISPEKLVIHTFNFKQGYLLIVGGTLLTVAQQEMITRFANVFQQTYTRFLDLQKAEALARESQIELALERVRARTMAMQKSEELKEVIQTVYEQFVALNINIEHTGFIIDYKKNDAMHIWLADKNDVTSEVVLPYFDCAHWNSFKEAKAKGENFFANLLTLKEKNKFYKDLFKFIPGVPEGLLEIYLEYPGLAISTVLLDNVGLYIENFDGISYSEKENDTLMRFGKVFQQTYTRFQDLQKAEAQTREAQIETALEKVRSRSMAMQQSEEIGDVAMVLYEQLTSLGGALWGTGFGFCEEKVAVDEYWFVNERGVMPPLKIPHTKDPTHKAMYKGWQDNLEILTIAKEGKELEKHYNYMLSVPDVQPIFQGMLDSGISFPTWQKWHAAYFKFGYLLVITTEPYHDEEILIRFAKVFEQSYTRFLDLQKAEAQARKAQIEASLERVRSQAMAMRQSEDLVACTRIVFDELEKLNLSIERSGIGIFDPATKDCQLWTTVVAQDGTKELVTGVTSLTVHPMLVETFTAWENQKPYSYVLEGKELEAYYTLVTKSEFVLSEELIEKSAALPKEYYHYSPFGAGGLYFFSNSEPFDEEKRIIHRFAEVFDLTYTRFLDLQKAEAQAREAQIEASLERVRSKTMAMHSSQDVGNTMVLLFEELETLGIKANRNGIIIMDEEEHGEIWTAKTNSNNEIKLIAWNLDMSLHNLTKQVYKAWKNKESGTVYPLIGEDQKAYYNALNKSTDIPVKFNLDTLPEREWGYTFNFNEGFIYLFTEEKMSQEHEQIPERFASVFGQTYRRYQDLQKAETQAREAQIEAALEKVRTVALSLTKSDDMLDIAQVLYEQLLTLGFNDIRNAIIDIHNDETETFLDYDYSDDMSSAVTEFSYYGDPVIEQQIKKTQSANDAFFEIELKGEQLEELIKTRIRNGEKDDPRLRKTDHLTYNLYSFGNGAIGISNFGILSDEQKMVLKRFRNVFTFAYKRYTDLANAEAQAREAKIEASLEKVRSVALSMVESTDLLHIVKALYEQLVELGFSDIRNALIDVNNEDEETFLDYDYSDEMGGTITLMAYDDDPTLEEQVKVIAATTDGFSEMVLEGQQLQDLIEMRRKNGEVDDPRLLKTDSVSYILYAFGNGAVGISNFGALSKDQKSILDRFRNVFTFAYQRFKDLQVREEQSAALLAEKVRLEKTLTDLQQTQKQLIQSEKMASLGELTAGIAHEIQNPLNFVNNFSEVSTELIEEIDEEMEKGDMEEVKAILLDVKQNLEKINHHGKRADAIVKGMLQHSRKSTAEKEPTNINKLAEEYLRLAYHGLRAKDKSFNATLETDFDESIGKVYVIPQDMGRVILNLITNAFYAVSEALAKESADSDYKPTVSVSTKKEKNKILISVKDNGNGIPKDAIDKIFQPFFTTKPTGEGTGLGLSMSYDIITKGHGGELTVETEENKGTTFIINLPINN